MNRFLKDMSKFFPRLHLKMGIEVWCIFFLMVFFSTAASGDTLFSESLNGSLGTFSYSGSVSASSTGATLRGSLFSSGRGTITSPPISTVGYTSVTLSFNRVSYGLDIGEGGIAEVSINGGAFTALESTRATSPQTVTLSLGSSAENQPSVVIRFRVNANSSTEYYRVSQVVVSGTKSGGGGGILPPVSTIETDGPFSVAIDQNTGPNRQGWVVRPATLGSLGVSKHPVFIWGPGGGTDQTNYEFHLRRIASHGFVVYSEASTGDGSEMEAAIDWLVQQNSRSTSPYYQKLDTSKIAAGGHSMGSLSTFAVANDPRLRTTIHVAGGSFDGTGPYNLRNPAMYIVGSADTLALSNVQRDYRNTTVPVWFGIMNGVDHIYAAREGLPAIVAWLRWHIANETWRQSMFIGSNCYFCGGMWSVQYKNW